MSLLNFDSKDNHPPRNRKSLKLVLGVGALVGVVALGSTLAASINLNGGGPVEFGQGVTQTTACDDEITITPYSTFINQEGGGEYYFSSLRVSGIDSSLDKCSGKTLKIKVYSDMGIVPLFTYEDSANSIDDDYNFVEISNDGGDFTWVSGGTDGDDVIPGPDNGITETSFTLSFTSRIGTITRTPLALAEDVTRITIESRDSTVDSDGAYSIGDTGPGGGIVFYVAETPFDCGPNLEAVCTYLEAVEGSLDPDRTWTSTADLDPSVANAVGTAIGTGYRNSIAIANQAGNNASTSAAVLAREYDNGGKTDWYLPSRDELNQMCKWQRGITGPTLTNLTSVCAGGTVNTGTGAVGFAGGYYWSSSDFGSSEFQLAWVQNFGDEAGDSTQSEGMKTSAYYLRPVRAF
jgi:hypothetical protein